MNLRLATRQSPLALWQARHVKARLEAAHPGARVTLVPIVTSGDRLQSQTLVDAGGKGLFIKELEEALLDNRADLAVHSMKDVPAEIPEGLYLTAFLESEDPRDAFVSSKFAKLADLPKGARVGTASLRRRAQLLGLRPDLQVHDLRGNVGTRLKRLDEGNFDALILACAGLKRLGEGARIREALPVSKFLPALGQGVIGVECRFRDELARVATGPLNHPATATRISVERALNAGLGGSCRAPVGGHAVIGEQIAITGWVGMPDGSREVCLRVEGGPLGRGVDMARDLAHAMLDAGAREILASVSA